MSKDKYSHEPPIDEVKKFVDRKKAEISQIEKERIDKKSYKRHRQEQPLKSKHRHRSPLNNDETERIKYTSNCGRKSSRN